MIDQPPEALVRGCNDPVSIGILSDWIEEQYGIALDYEQSGWSNGHIDGYDNRHGDGTGYGDGFIFGYDNGDGDGYGFGSGIASGSGSGRGNGYGNRNGCGVGYGWYSCRGGGFSRGYLI